MSDPTLRTRKRDLWKKLRVGRSLSREAPPTSHEGSLYAGTSGSGPSNTEIPSNSNPPPPLVSQNMNPPQAPAPLSSSVNVVITPSPIAPLSGTSPPAVTAESDQSMSPVTLNPVHPAPSGQPVALPNSNRSTSRDLWADALRDLSTEDQQAIERLQPTQETKQPLSETIQELLRLTKMVQDKCEAKSYRFQFRGRDIILRDVAGKIIFWLNKFKDIGDIAVNFDPVHARLPWICVRFLLQVCNSTYGNPDLIPTKAAIAEHEQMEDLVVISEKLSCLISRGAIYERIYQPGKMSGEAVGNLDNALVKLYATILQMMALCHRLFNKNTAKRAVHAIFKPNELSRLLEKCEKLEVTVEYETHNCERTRSQAADDTSKTLLESLREPILRIDERVLSLLEDVEEEERLKILEWTSKVLYGFNHQTVVEKRTPGTCQWLLSHTRYKDWQGESASTILWLCGTGESTYPWVLITFLLAAYYLLSAGTGKTFLTSQVIDNIQSALKSQSNQEGFAFFYCNRNEAERREPLSVLRAFLRQLSTAASDNHSIQKQLRVYYNETRLKASEPTMEDCKKLLLEFINVYPRTTLVLDALDECERGKRLELVEILDNLLAEASNPLKIFISSRPDGDIKEKSKSRDNIEINANDNNKDISSFIKSEIVKHRRWGKMHLDLQTQIINTLQQKSQGM